MTIHRNVTSSPPLSNTNVRSFCIGFITCLLLLPVKTVFAQEVIDVQRTESLTTEDASAAKSLLLDQAIANASLESIKSIIGEEKTNRSKEIISNKIIKNSNKYILSIKTQNIERKGLTFSGLVELKLSLKGLRSLLLENGLLYQLDGPPKVLPAIYFVDRPGARSYGWWSPRLTKEHAFLMNQAGTLNVALKNELHKIGFYTMTPITSRFGNSVPETFRGENLQRADYLFLGEFFKSSVVVRGQIVFRANPDKDGIYLIDVRLEALHTSNGRLMAEVVRTYETESSTQYRTVVSKKFETICDSLAADLSEQISEAWKKGTFGSSVLKLAVVGKINPQQLEVFKKNVVLQVRDIKALRERWIENRKTTFEIDSSVLPQQLAKSLQAAKFSQFRLEVQGVESDGLTVSVEAH